MISNDRLRLFSSVAVNTLLGFGPVRKRGRGSSCFSCVSETTEHLHNKLFWRERAAFFFFFFLFLWARLSQLMEAEHCINVWLQGEAVCWGSSRPGSSCCSPGAGEGKPRNVMKCWAHRSWAQMEIFLNLSGSELKAVCRGMFSVCVHCDLVCFQKFNC